MIHVLHIDNDITDLELVKAYLLKEDPELSITFALSGKKANELLKIQTFDCVIIDYQLGDIDGLLLLKKIRKLYPGLPIVFMTGWRSEDVAQEAFRSGADDYFIKDIIIDNPDQFAASIRDVIQKKKAI
jgi:CheY-like chemotaxis protein